MLSIENLKDTIVAKSDQLNADDLIGSSITIKVKNVSRVDSNEQPISIHYDGDNGKPFKPCKTVRRILVFAWGENGKKWIGREMELFNDQTVMYAGAKVGGIRVSKLSHIHSSITVSLSSSRGKKIQLTIHPLLHKQKDELSDVKNELTEAFSIDKEKFRELWGGLPDEVKEKLKNEKFLDKFIKST